MMIVEDHSAFAQALGLVLGKGTQISLARTLEEGRTPIRTSTPFDVVVLDLALPNGEGTELIPEIRQRHPQSRVAVLSAREDIDEVASEVGAEPLYQWRRPCLASSLPSNDSQNRETSVRALRGCL